jgi:hypothetical protein
MAKRRKSITEEHYAEPDDIGRCPPYFGEREPVCHVVTEKIHLQWALHALSRLGEAAKMAFNGTWVQKQRRRRRRDPVEAVAKELWPPDGRPPETMATPAALRRLGKACERRKIPASPDTLRRAIGRRERR